MHSLYVDYCYKLNHLKTADAASNVWEAGTKAPPNARFFISDQDVIEHISQPHARALPDEKLSTCSDFKADEVSACPAKRDI